MHASADMALKQALPEIYGRAHRQHSGWSAASIITSFGMLGL